MAMTLEQERAVAVAKAKLAQARAATVSKPAGPDATHVNHAMSGVNEAIAGFAGIPVDVVTAGLNAVLPEEWEIQKPFLGSEMLQGTMTDAGAITTAEPDTMGKRFAHRIGQEVGAYAIPGLGFLGKAGNIGREGVALLAQALAGGGAAAVANEALPGNATADLLASLLGGGAVVAGSHALRPNPNRAPTATELNAAKGAAYANVEADTGTLTARSLEELVAGLRTRAADKGLHPVHHPEADAALRQIESAYGPTGSPGYARTPPRIYDIEEERRLVNNNVVMSLKPSEAKLGRELRSEIDDYLTGLTPNDVTGGNPSMTIAELQRARDLAQREFKANQITSRAEGAELSAATSGTGGNEINRIRQEIKWIIDPKYPNRAKGFSADEIKMMQDIARGGPVENLLRLVGKLSPTTGGLQVGTYAGATAMGGLDPKILAAALAGFASKKAGEAITKSKVNSLVDALRAGKPVPGKPLNDAERRMLEMLMISGAAAPEPAVQ